MMKFQKDVFLLYAIKKGFHEIFFSQPKEGHFHSILAMILLRICQN